MGGPTRGRDSFTYEEPAPDAGHQGQFDGPQKPTRRHEGIADGLDLLHLVIESDALEVLDQGLEVRDHIFRRVTVAIGGEADDIGEQDGDVLIAPGRDAAGRLQFGHRRRRQDDVQEIVRALLLGADVFEMRGFLYHVDWGEV